MDAGEDDALRGEVVIPCADVSAMAAFLCDELGCRVDSVSPADDPETIAVSGPGLRLRLVRDGRERAPITLFVAARDVESLRARMARAPRGLHVELARSDAPTLVPPLAASLSVAPARGARWAEGRAGMRYRDLLPDRQGGRFIASLIRVEAAGPVPDYVHFHRVRLQVIYCHRGWVRVAYEGEGDPIVMEPGDCVVQPPTIRHRVLACSEALEVIEVTCPARHDTIADHELELPSASIDRECEGQRFVHDRAAAAVWAGEGGLRVRRTGIGEATRGVVEVSVARASGERDVMLAAHDAELVFRFVLRGRATLRAGDGVHALAEGDAFTVPAGVAHALVAPSTDLEWLEVAVPEARR